MNRRILMQMLGLAVAAMLLGGCFDNSITRNFKIIATAVVDGQEVQGSTVIRATWTEAHSNRGNYVDEEGEAIILDLKDHGTVYVLPCLSNKDNSWYCSWALRVAAVLEVKENGNSAEFSKITNAQGRYALATTSPNGVAQVIAAFHDETRKNSVYGVMPTEFQKAFGPSVTFKSLEFEPTDEPVTQVLLKRLPMLGKDDPNNSYAPPIIPGHLKSLSEQSFPERIGDGYFFQPYLGKSFYANRKQEK